MFASYIICTTPRSGSTLLCRLLASTGRTGDPDSFYHREQFMREWATAWKLPQPPAISRDAFDRAYLDAALNAGKGGSGIFGLRLQQEFVALLSETLDRLYPGLASDADRFARAFGQPLYLYLTRADKVAQAVSLVKAEQSGLWHLNADGTDFERFGEPREPIYDFQRLRREVVALERAEAAWRAWFDTQGISPVHIPYEAVAERPAEALIDICGMLGVAPPPADTIKPPLAKLSDAASLAWIRRYHADLAADGRGETDVPAV